MHFRARAGVCVCEREREGGRERRKNLKTTRVSLLQLELPDNLVQESEQQGETSY